MKAQELMIGDWVQKGSGDKFIITGFSIRSFLLEKVFDCGFNIREALEHREFMIEGVGPDLDNYEILYCTPESEVNPIQLTPEILEKNGFINGEFYAESHIEDWQIMSDGSHLAARSDRGWCIDIPCRYIHELQHALRLCGIEKEIVL